MKQHLTTMHRNKLTPKFVQSLPRDVGATIVEDSSFDFAVEDFTTSSSSPSFDGGGGSFDGGGSSDEF